MTTYDPNRTTTPAEFDGCGQQTDVRGLQTWHRLIRIWRERTRSHRTAFEARIERRPVRVLDLVDVREGLWET